MWTYNNHSISSISDLPSGAYGFIYLIRNKSKDKIYIGRKNLYTRRKRKFGKKEIEAMPDKRASKWEYIEKESDWMSYNSSNSELKKDIASGDEVEKKILQIAYNKAEMTYYETKFQFLFEVLETDSYCDNILGKFYRKLFAMRDDDLHISSGISSGGNKGL
jgi:hypothetical protein